MLRSLLLGTAVPVQQLLSNTFTGSRLQSVLASAHILQALQQQSFSASAQANPSSQQHGHEPEHQEQQTDLQPAAQELEHIEAEVSLQQHQQQQVVLPVQRQRLDFPILPTHIVLKAVRDWQGDPPTKHDLFHSVQRDYAAVFPSMRQFNGHLQHIVNKNWVASKKDPTAAPAATPSQPKKGNKKSKGGQAVPFVYVATAYGKKVDVNVAGSQLRQEARRIADEWTSKKLPAYVTQLQAGRIPVTPDNVQLLVAEEGLARFRDQQQQSWRRHERKLQRKQRGKQQRQQK